MSASPEGVAIPVIEPETGAFHTTHDNVMTDCGIELTPMWSRWPEAFAKADLDAVIAGGNICTACEVDAEPLD